MKDLIEKFEEKVRKEFPDLSTMTVHHDKKCVTFDLWPYTDEGMNALENVVQKVIKRYFKDRLKRLDEEEYWDLVGEDEVNFSNDEDIVVKILNEEDN